MSDPIADYVMARQEEAARYRKRLWMLHEELAEVLNKNRHVLAFGLYHDLYAVWVKLHTELDDHPKARLSTAEEP